MSTYSACLLSRKVAVETGGNFARIENSARNFARIENSARNFARIENSAVPI